MFFFYVISEFGLVFKSVLRLLNRLVFIKQMISATVIHVDTNKQ